MKYKDILDSKEAFILELDDVIYPEKDYLLQVYYLFANLLEYSAQHPPAADLIAFFKKAYEQHGPHQLFQRAVDIFGIDNQYQSAFNKLHVSAKLPLKLLLYPQIKALLTDIFKANKKALLLVKGNPLMQLNKLKQMEWEGLEQQLKVYFYDELIIKGIQHPLAYVLTENSLKGPETLLITKNKQNPYPDSGANLAYMTVDLLLS